MHINELTYIADGLNMRSELYIPDGATHRPGILVFPEALGLSAHVRSRARQFAEMGYAALACDLHGDATLYQEASQLGELLRPIIENPVRVRDRCQGALDALVDVPEVDSTRIAAVGFCFGGTMALELARSGVAILATVGFHCGLQTARPEDAKNIRGRVLVAVGAEDPIINMEQRNSFEREMRAGNVDWQIHTYGGVVHALLQQIGRVPAA